MSTSHSELHPAWRMIRGDKEKVPGYETRIIFALKSAPKLSSGRTECELLRAFGPENLHDFFEIVCACCPRSLDNPQKIS